MSWFDNSEDFGLLKPGTYLAEIYDFKFDVLGNAATETPPSMKIQYKLDSNKRLFQNFKFNEKGRKWLTWQMGIIGLNDEAKKLVKGEESAAKIAKAYCDASKELLGKRVEIEVGHNTYTDRTGNERTVETVKLLGFAEAFGAGKTSEPPDFDHTEPLPF